MSLRITLPEEQEQQFVELLITAGVSIERELPPYMIEYRAKLDMSVADLEFEGGYRVRVVNALWHADLRSVGEVVQKTESELLMQKMIGRKGLDALKEALAKLDLHLGMNLIGWEPPEIE